MESLVTLLLTIVALYLFFISFVVSSRGIIAVLTYQLLPFVLGLLLVINVAYEKGLFLIPTN